VFSKLDWYKAVLLIVLSVFSFSGNTAIPERVIQGSSVPSLAPIVNKATPAVINIATYTVQAQAQNPLLSSPFFRHFFRLPDDLSSQPKVQRRTQSAGSGVIVDADKGYILTNHHVISGADEIEVTLQDGRKFTATLLGTDKKVDLAVIAIEADNLSAINFADANGVQVGDFVLAIGSPFGLQQTVTSGIVSALGRNSIGALGYEDFIQTDASINPGNSGGALIDLRGELIGINSAILAPSGGNIGIGFAIPADIAKSVMLQLVKYGEVKRGGIGASFQDLTAELAEAFNLQRYQGALVAHVEPDSPAKKAGLQQGDIIIKANGRSITNAKDMTNRIGLSALDSQIRLEVLRDGQSQQLSVRVAEIPIPEISGHLLDPELSGAQLQDVISKDQEQAIGIQVIGLAPNSIAAQQGFEDGDIIFGLNRKRVRSIRELQYLLSHESPRTYNLQRGYQELVIYVR